MTYRFEKIGIQAPAVLFPDKSVDLAKWPVVACDQYTSQPDYWKTVEEFVGESPSTLHLIFPEVYLEQEGKEERMEKINKNMKTYLAEGILKSLGSCFIYIDRQTSHSESRKGLILAVDLEKYDYNKGSHTLIRATEGTVIERLPPRIKIRENATVELPHIMLLIDDPEKTVIEPLAQKVEQFEKLYDFDLMMGGMHIKGYKIDSVEVISHIANALEKLADSDVFSAKYGVSPENGILLFAVGDGNHSLAAAKGHWENVKNTLSPGEIPDHPARYAMVEVVNVHDEGLKFEPIHRVLFNVDTDKLLNSMVEFFSYHSSASYKLYETETEFDMDTAALKHDTSSHTIPFKAAGKFGAVIVKDPTYTLEVGTLQSFLDEFIKLHREVRIDYIHGDDVVDGLSSKEGNIGFYLPSMDKRDLFRTVIIEGTLPRKTFSMGEAEEKRFYLECRKIVK